MRISIRNGRLIDPANDIDAVNDLHIADGYIVAVGNPPDGFTTEREIDASGLVVCPGLVDLSVRLREPGQEHKGTIASELDAAVTGGVTSVCCQPDTNPVLDNPAVAELIHQRAINNDLCRILPLAALTRELAGKTLTDMNALKEIGCIGVSNANADMADAEVLRRTLEYASSCNLTVHLMCEDPGLKNQGVVHEGPLSTRLGLPGIPPAAEILSVSRALLLAEHTGARVHLSRITCADSIPLIALARDKGLPVTADVSICHLHLNDMAVDGFNTDCHLDPPLRTEADRVALISALADGIITAVCSDHQPHDKDAKAAPFSLSEPGASTIEHLLGLMMKLVNDDHLPLERAIAAVTRDPASIVMPDLGRLDVDRPADVCIFNPDQTTTINNKTMFSAGKNTPFHGWRIPATVTHTLVDGRLVYTAD